jgi:hypothetical protein
MLTTDPIDQGEVIFIEDDVEDELENEDVSKS